MPWDESRLRAVEQSTDGCPDACAADVASLASEVRRLQRLLDRAYPWLHNPYHGTGDIANAAEGDAVIEAVQTVIQHLTEEPDPLLKLPCGSCDGTGKIGRFLDGNEEEVMCPNCAPISVEG